MRKGNCWQYGAGAAELNTGKSISLLLNLSEPFSAKIAQDSGTWASAGFQKTVVVDLLSPGHFNPRPIVCFISRSRRDFLTVVLKLVPSSFKYYRYNLRVRTLINKCCSPLQYLHDFKDLAPQIACSGPALF